ncbi:MAG: hypothetical protein K2N72_10670, partial [Oscillospiraceae bacterium]|nr:hypothetical protein [Oscillospiraceae bacterium]
QTPQTPDKSEIEASRSNAEKPPEKTLPKAAEKVKSSPLNADSDEAKNALDFFRKMSGVTGAQTPQTPDKSEIETSYSNAEKPPEETLPKADEKAESSPPNVDSDEAENALKFFREMSGVTGSEPTEQTPDKSNDLVDEASVRPVRDEQSGDVDGQAQTENLQNAEPENTEQPRPYKPFDITDIPKTEVYVPPSDELEENITEKCSLAVCGADCNDCPFGEENDCPGCGGLWEDCDIVRCAAVKGHEHCGLCDKFPCDLLRGAAFDPDSGDNGDRLLRLKSLGEAANSRRKPRLIMAGGCGGIALGTAIGGFSGALIPWIFAMTVVGAGVGLMAAVSVKNKGQPDRGKKQ